MPAPEPLREQIRPRLLPAEPRADARAVAGAVTSRAGDAVAAIVFFGSRKSGAAPGPGSAYDFFVVVPSYREFYAALAASGSLRKRAPVLAALNTVLPPNVISLPATLPDGTGVVAKCAIVSSEHFQRETSERRKDHFIAGRLFQATEVIHARDPAAAELALDAVAGAHALSYLWCRPWLPELFDVETYCRTLLRVSFGWEIRAEPSRRTETLYEAQRDYLEPVYGAYLRHLAATGELMEHEGGLYSLARPVQAVERRRLERFFKRSLVRATTRWAKYMVTFDDWLEFIVRKARRHTGEELKLTPRERRYPLIFLWPRFIRYLRHKDSR
jgi:hypothetical protein